MISANYKINLKAGIDIVQVEKRQVKRFEEYILFESHGKEEMLYKCVEGDKLFAKIIDKKDIEKIFAENNEHMLEIFKFEDKKDELIKRDIYTKTGNNLFDDLVEKNLNNLDEDDYLLYNKKICIIANKNNIINFITDPENSKLISIDELSKNNKEREI